MSTAAQTSANRANSQFSSGPKTEAGKAKSSHNAVKSALTGQTILLPTDDVPAYQRLVQTLIDLHRPVSYEEQLLVQSLADLEWRLLRIPTLESGLYALGRMEFAGLHSECQDPQLRAALIETQIYLKYERNLRNLSLQETRLCRMRQKDLARLREIQAERKEAAQAAAKRQPAKAAPAPDAAPNPVPAADEIGFEFSNSSQSGKEAA